MKKVLLLGDSIRIRYQNAVTRNLEGIAKVYNPGYTAEDEAMEKSVENVNCRDTSFTLNNLTYHLWGKKIQGMDLIHYNNGIWDAVIRHVEDGSFTTIEWYEINVRRILRELKKITPNIIIATTTPPRTDERKNPHTGIVTLTVDTVKRYNEVLWRIADEMRLPVNDLFTLTMSDREKYILESDEIHLTEAGEEALGKQTADIIKKYL
ncbi:MAG: SGNH/GDSL hydrolase family protein [Clostridia bacterium]|nr:SGNH/GDSL hydrolase family protein [Clostridia bacterium]